MKHLSLRRNENLSLSKKITTIIWFFTTVIMLLILLMFSVFHHQAVLSDARVASRRFTDNSVTILNTNYGDIIEHFIFCFGTAESVSDFTAINNPGMSFLYKRDLLQEELNLMNNSNYLVQGTIVFSQDGQTCFTSYSDLTLEADSCFIDAGEMKNSVGITWLPVRPSPFRKASNVIPVVFPLCIDSSKEMRLVNSGDETAIGYVVVFLDCGKLTESLISNSIDDPDRSFLFVNENGNFLFASDTAFSLNNAEVQTLISSRSDHLGNYDAYSLRLKNAPVFFIHYSKKTSVFEVLSSIAPLLASSILIVLLALYLMSVLIKKYVTKPVRSLVRIVREIENGNYSQHVMFDSKDELGLLCRAINEMHDTLQTQIVQIQQKEQEKYRTELQLLTEQINPHFLYNTLNCIQVEVGAGYSSSAVRMIRNLTDYLRIGLSNSSMTITVENEIHHAQAYIEIMNYRFASSIVYTCSVDPILAKHLIPKTILQPLIENSINHGFQINHNTQTVAYPSLEIALHLHDDKLSISVIDNGVGFDPEKTKQLLYHDPQEHIGLHNILSRLELYYGKEAVNCTLSSIPYFKNEITFTVPYLPEQCQS